MAYIVPNSILQVFTDMGLSPSHDDTLYFSSESAKDAYFAVEVARQYTALSYQRHSKNSIRIQAPTSDLYNMAYMRFKNTSFENKWFYAFITNVEYINNVTTEITYELDYMMTWMGTFQLAECYVERQHTLSDHIGANLADEGIPCGDYIIEDITSSGFIGSGGYWYCFASTFDPENPTEENHTVASGEYGGIYSGIEYHYTPSVDTLNNWITTATTAGKSDGIVGISIVPRQFITDKDELPVVKAQTFPKPYTSVTNADGNGSFYGGSLGAYVPKNNKLFIYPYKVLSVTNCEGNFAEFKFEMFSGLVSQFTFIGSTGLQSEVVCEPINYKNTQRVITEKMSMADFPMCTFVNDSFSAYLAQNKSSIAVHVMSTALSSVGSLATGLSAPVANPTIGSATNAAGGMINNSMNIFQSLAQLQDYARKPMQSHGSQGTNPLLKVDSTKAQRKDFYFVTQSITSNYAKMIDDYFTAFGYAVKELKVPNMNARPNFTYVKTIGCVVHGDIPSSDALAIEAIFDKGVRFWKNHRLIGNYEVNNAPGS